MSTTAPNGVLPPIPEGFALPFYYGTFTNLGVDYLVPEDRAALLLKECAPHAELSVATFDGKACLSFNYQMYFAQFAHGGSVIQEIELNIVSYPTVARQRVPELTYKQYAFGEDQTRDLGFCRHRVACDSPLAIEAGEKLFGEPKFRADFEVPLPVPNANPTTAPGPSTGGETVVADTWKVACVKHRHGEDGAGGDPHFSFTADLRNIRAETVSTAPFTEYGSRERGESVRALAAPLNVFQPYQWYDLAKAEKRVALKLGEVPDARIKRFVEAIGTVEPVGAWLHQSPPVAAQNRPYYLPGE
ncbi:hypothetical protein [Nocardiopsis lucentensis]|uniref:hypothetical protein n=1 Tax=Nocardiopsis lucentensis TaxID=53441 RepID=UPI00034BEC7A|nr:hypothetical protein [Nocardiopsis lucentensis]